MISDNEISLYLHSLHIALMSGNREEKRKYLTFFMRMLTLYCTGTDDKTALHKGKIAEACDYMKRNFDRQISLDEICRHVGMSKSSLLRIFTKAVRVTPYRYLENIRVSRAKELLEAGVQPVDAAMMTGFSDQSHFTNCFTKFFGFPPAFYRSIFTKTYI